MLSSSSYRRYAINAAVSTLIQSILWVICFILYICTYTCEINPLFGDSSDLVQGLSIYVQAFKCVPVLDIIDIPIDVTICHAISSQSTSVLLGLLCAGISINVSLLITSILLIKKIWKTDESASGIIQVLIFYISSLFIASGWDMVVTGYAINDYSTVSAVQNLECETISNGVMAFFLITSRGFIVWLFNIICGFILLNFVLRTKPVKRNVNAIENEGYNTHSSKINNEVAWTTPDPMVFGRQPPPHSAMSKWPHLAALNQQEQSQPHLRQNVINRREDDEIQSRWNIFGPGDNDLQDKQQSMDNWSKPQATNFSRTQSITSEGNQWSKMQNRYDNVLESYESSPISGPRLNRNPSVSSKQTSMTVQRDWNQRVPTNEQVGSVSPPQVQPKRPLNHLPSDAFRYDSGDLFWNVKLRPVRPPPGVKAEEVKRPTEPAPPPPTRENPPPPPPPASAPPLDFAPTSPSYEEDSPRPMSLQEAILTIRPLKTVKRPSFNHLRQN